VIEMGARSHLQPSLERRRGQVLSLAT
jgi:hypothetical protein